MSREKKICKAPFHPFKQQWYWYEPGMPLADAQRCSSCTAYVRFIKGIVSAMLQPQATLYGDALIQMDKGDLIALLQSNDT